MGNHNLKAVIKEGTVENVKEFLAEQPDMKNHVFRYGWTPCHLAVEYHKLDILKYLVEEAESDIKHVDNAESNLLHHALHFAESHFDIVKYLLESGKFKFDSSKDEHDNTPLHLAFKYCTLKEIAELNKYYKGLKDLFQEKNDHGLTPLAILRERCKHSPDSLLIVEKLQHEIENAESPHGSKRNSSDEDNGKKHSGEEGRKGSSRRTSHKKKNSHEGEEEKDEDKKHSDDEKEKKGSKLKHSKDHDDKKHGSSHGSKHEKHDGDKKHGSKHGSKHDKHHHDEEHKKHGSKHDKHDEKHEGEKKGSKKHHHKKHSEEDDKSE